MVNINPLYTTRELEYALEKVDAKMLVCQKTIGPLNYHAKVQELTNEFFKRYIFGYIGGQIFVAVSCRNTQQK